MRFLGGGPELLQIGLAAKPHRFAVKNRSVLIRHPSLSEHPARLLANATEHDLQGGRKIAGRCHVHRDRLQQVELLFAR